MSSKMMVFRLTVLVVRLVLIAVILTHLWHKIDGWVWFSLAWLFAETEGAAMDRFSTRVRKETAKMALEILKVQRGIK